MNLKHFITHPVFNIVSACAAELGADAFVIGGFVRDLLLNRPCKDIDVVTHGNGIELAQKVAIYGGKQRRLTVYKNFGTAMLHWDDYIIEFVGARKESYRADSRKPVVEGGTLEDDRKRRDFTINTLSISLQKENYGDIIDSYRGLSDLQAKILRTPLDPGVTFSDDPLRMMRAIRFASQLGFEIEGNSYKAIKSNKERIKIVSQERITDELNKIILSTVPSVGLKLLFNSGLLQLIFPQFTALQGVSYVNGLGHKDNFYHTLKVLDNVAEKSENLWLRWAAILHDIAKPATKQFDTVAGWTFHGHEDKGARMIPQIFRQLKLPMDTTMKYVQKLVQLHLRPIALSKETVSDSGLRRLLFDAGNDIEDLMTLCEADITSKNDEKVKRYLNNFRIVREKLVEVEAKDRIRNWQPPVTGEEIMKVFHLLPCREVGVIKNAIREAILDGVIRNDRKEAIELMLKKAKETGLTVDEAQLLSLYTVALPDVDEKKKNQDV